MEWAIVEVFGHQRYAGQIEEVTRAGATMLRVHVPAFEHTRTERSYRPTVDSWTHEVWTRKVHERYPEHTIDLGGGALFRVRATTEERARLALPHCTRDEEPIRTEGEWMPPDVQLTGPVAEPEEVEAEIDVIEVEPVRRITRDEIPF